MKNKIYSLLASLVAVIFFTACDDHKYGSEFDTYGRISFANFGVSVEKTDSESGSRAVQTIDASNYIVTITNKTTKRQALKKTFGELPGVIDLPTGTYTIKVESHKLAKAEFDKPYYTGSQEVTIEEDKVSDAGTIVCKFASVGVMVTFSEKLTPLLGDDVVVTVTGTSGARLEYTKNETRTGYFEFVNGSTTLYARITGTVNGKPIEEDNTQTIINAAAGKVFVLRFMVKGLPEKPDETGSIDITPGEGVTIDTSIIESDDNNINGNVNVEEEVIKDPDRPGQEDPGTNPPDDPTPPVGDEDAISITSDTFDLDAVNDALSTVQYIVKVGAEKGVKNLKVKIDSEYLTQEFLESVGLTSEFDLAHPGSYEEALVGFGLPVGSDVIDHTQVEFDLSDLIPLLNLDPDKRTHRFILTVVDGAGNQKSKTLVFKSVEE